MKHIDAAAYIQKVAEYAAETKFTDEAKENETAETLQLEGLGIALSQWAQWDGEKLMRVFRSALEDCNYTEAAQVEEMIKALNEPEFQNDIADDAQEWAADEGQRLGLTQ